MAVDRATSVSVQKAHRYCYPGVKRYESTVDLPHKQQMEDHLFCSIYSFVIILFSLGLSHLHTLHYLWTAKPNLQRHLRKPDRFSFKSRSMLHFPPNQNQPLEIGVKLYVPFVWLFGRPFLCCSRSKPGSSPDHLLRWHISLQKYVVNFNSSTV